MRRALPANIKRAADRHKRIASETRKQVVVFGPGKSSAAIYPLRERIREALREEFPHLRVWFPEDWSAEQSNAVVHETSLLDDCDICLVLEIAIGAISEVAFFGQRYSHRIAVLQAAAFEGSFHTQLKTYLQIPCYVYRSEDMVVEQAIELVRGLVISTRS